MEDLKYGNDGENELVKEFANLGLTLEKFSDKYSTFDFREDKHKLLIEVKSRRCKWKHFPTVMIGLNKITEGMKKLGAFRVFLVFRFTDGTYFYELREFNPQWTKETKLKNDRVNESLNQMYYIDMDLLKPISEFVI